MAQEDMEMGLMVDQVVMVVKVVMVVVQVLEMDQAVLLPLLLLVITKVPFLFFSFLFVSLLFSHRTLFF